MFVLTSSWKAYSRTFSSFYTHCCVVMPLMRNNCHSWLTSDTMCVPVATRAFQDTREIQNSNRSGFLNGNNRPQSLKFLWMFRLQHKSFTCRKALQANACNVNLDNINLIVNNSKDLKLILPVI